MRARSALAVATMVLGLATATTGGALAEPDMCRQITVPVTLAGQSGPLAGTLCVPDGAQRLQVLISGLGFDRSYWDFPIPEYSYTAWMARRGEAVLAIDRLGTGASWHPPSGMLGFLAHVSAVEQLLQAVHSGRLGFRPRSVVLVGHSYGAAVASAVAASPGVTVDAYIGTGTAHTWFANTALASSPTVMWPAQQDPKFAGAQLDPGYMAMRPGVQAAMFNSANSDTEVIAQTEDGRATIGYLDVPSAMTAHIPPLAVPALVVLGAADIAACGPAAVYCSSSSQVADFERGALGAPAVEAAIIAESGHLLNLEHSRVRAWETTAQFLDKLETGECPGAKGE